jgi:hypothetical protein
MPMRSAAMAAMAISMLLEGNKPIPNNQSEVAGNI